MISEQERVDRYFGLKITAEEDAKMWALARQYKVTRSQLLHWILDLITSDMIAAYLNPPEEEKAA